MNDDLKKQYLCDYVFPELLKSEIKFSFDPENMSITINDCYIITTDYLVEKVDEDRSEFRKKLHAMISLSMKDINCKPVNPCCPFMTG